MMPRPAWPLSIASLNSGASTSRAENAQAQLRWLTLLEAHDTTSEPNLREALTRIEPLLKPRAT